MNRIKIITHLVGVGLMAGSNTNLMAASHSDAPLIKQDPQANITDVYAFVGTRYDDPQQKVLNVVVQVRPFSEPGDGPHYDRFADDARYSIHITNPTTAETLMRYDFFFSDVDRGLKNQDTILSFGLGTAAGPIMNLDDAQQNFTQTYRVRRKDGRRFSTIGSGLLTSIPNVGGNVTPLYNDADGRTVSGAANFAGLDAYTQQAIQPLASGEVVFAGPRDDGFFADIPGIFDLLNARILDNNGDLGDGLGQDGGGVNGFKGFNVLSFGIQIPVEDLPTSMFNSVFFGEQTGVGVYASVSRRALRILKSNGKRIDAGPFVQVNRMGNPLFNEAFVSLADKDKFNKTSPTGDSQNFATYAENPELADLINLLFGTNFQNSQREDLVNIFIPDVLRVATTTDPVRLSGQAGFSRLGFLGDDNTSGISSGFPNGRRFGDDVIDIALTALASGPTFDAITLVGDNVSENDIPYNNVFPYGGTPHSGSNNSKDP